MGFIYFFCSFPRGQDPRAKKRVRAFLNSIAFKSCDDKNMQSKRTKMAFKAIIF